MTEEAMERLDELEARLASGRREKASLPLGDGDLAREGDPDICYDRVVTSNGSLRPCAHAKEVADRVLRGSGEHRPIELSWVLPRVLLVNYDNGYGKIDFCFDCLRDAILRFEA